MQRLEAAIPVMRRADRFIEMAREESDDLTFAFVASSLAAHFHVSKVVVQNRDGSETQFKRGAAYVAALRTADSWQATQPKPEAA